MATGSRHAYTTFIDSGLIYNEWGGRKTFSLFIGGRDAMLEGRV